MDDMTSKKTNMTPKLLFWILVIIVIVAAFNQGMLNTLSVQRSVGNFQPTTIQAEQVNVPGFVKYSNTEAGFNFSVLFPTSNPKIFALDAGEFYIKSFQAPHVIDLKQKKAVQYSVFFYTIKEGKIFSDESIKASLKSFPKGKVILSGNTLTKEEMTTYKGLTAIQYVFSDEIQGISYTHKGMAFIVDGILIDLSVVYSDVTSLSSVYYNDYIRSFTISEK